MERHPSHHARPACSPNPFSIPSRDAGLRPASSRTPVLPLLVALLLVGSPASSEPWPLPGSEVVRVHSPTLRRTYRAVVILPPRFDPARRYPALFFTDLPRSAALVAGLYRTLRSGGRGLQDAILVGLDHAEGETAQYSRRRDYTPSPHGDIDATSDMPGRPVVYGEAEAYRRHLETELLPELERRYPIDAERRIFLGHSYGGLFGAHVLLTAPRMFAQYVLISPSLWFDRRLMLARERGRATLERDLPARVLLMVGSLETVENADTEPFAAAIHDMVGDTLAFAQGLRARGYPSLHLDVRVLDGEDHDSAFAAGVRLGLEWALPGTGRVARRPCPPAERFCRWPRWRAAPDAARPSD